MCVSGIERTWIMILWRSASILCYYDCPCVWQVVVNRDTNETLLCIAYVFEVSSSEHGAQHHIYRLVRDWETSLSIGSVHFQCTSASSVARTWTVLSSMTTKLLLPTNGQTVLASLTISIPCPPWSLFFVYLSCFQLNLVMICQPALSCCFDCRCRHVVSWQCSYYASVRLCCLLWTVDGYVTIFIACNACILL